MAMHRRALLILLPGPGAKQPGSAAHKRSPSHPSSRPLGRAALTLEDEGVPVYLGASLREGQLSAWRADPSTDRWGVQLVRTEELRAVHDRYPSQARAPEWRQLLNHLDHLPIGNPPQVTLLCKDKLRCAEFLTDQVTRQPPSVGEPSCYPDSLRAWGSAFLKPRFGSQGEGVEFLEYGPRALKRLEQCAEGQWVLQQAISPPQGLAGLALRVLVQATETGWWVGPPVARRSPTDPVVSVSRGASAAPARDVLSRGKLRELSELSRHVAEKIRSASANPDWVVELGLDFVLDEREGLWLIEVNSCPRGRLLHLAASSPEHWAEEHSQATLRPLRRLLELG